MRGSWGCVVSGAKTRVTGFGHAHIIVFCLLWLTCCTYALWRGGASERCAAGLELIAVILPILVQAPFRTNRYYTDLSVGIFLIDGSFLFALCAIALTADRFWPVFAAGCQVADMIVDLAKLVAPDILPLGYGVSFVASFYPKLILFTIGTRRARYGADPPWSRSLAAASPRISARSS